MNNRIKKKKFYKGIVNKIYGCDAEIIVMEYKNHSISVNNLRHMYQSVCGHIKDKTIIVMPDTISLKDCNREQLIQMRDQLNKIIDSL